MNINTNMTLEEIVRALDVLDNATYNLFAGSDTSLLTPEQNAKYRQYNSLHEQVNTAWKLSLRAMRIEQERLDAQAHAN